MGQNLTGNNPRSQRTRAIGPVHVTEQRINRARSTTRIFFLNLTSLLGNRNITTPLNKPS
jgi:hypothetical protein